MVTQIQHRTYQGDSKIYSKENLEFKMKTRKIYEKLNKNIETIIIWNHLKMMLKLQYFYCDLN